MKHKLLYGILALLISCTTQERNSQTADTLAAKTPMGSRDSISSIETSTPEQSDDDDCVFNNDYKGLTIEWLKELNITEFVWRDDLKQALVPKGQLYINIWIWLLRVSLLFVASCSNQLFTLSTFAVNFFKVTYDANRFLFNWNTPTIGNYVIEGWIEEDGGSSTTTITQTYAAPSSCSGCPATTVSYTKKNDDQDLGRSIIQYSDSKSQWYSVSYMDIKHK
jgi:hypothetical protein